MRIDGSGDVLTWIAFVAFAASCGFFIAGVAAARRMTSRA